MLRNRVAGCILLVLLASGAWAGIFSSVRGLVHDPQHRPIEGAEVTLRAAASDWSKSTASGDSGEFYFEAVPLGEYVLTVEAPGFAVQQQGLLLTSGREAKPHIQLQLAQPNETVTVQETVSAVNPETSTSASVVSRRQIAETPGADQATSMAMITARVPGAYMIHDQLHIRGGHQVSWLLDGVPVPNTNIASNVGPQFDPKDIDYLEVQRGGLTAEYGDRTYGVFNVVTRSGFERSRQGEVALSYGSYNSTHDQISFGDHSDRLAYYASLSGYRTDLGLQTPSPEIIHDLGSGLGGFASLIFNKSASDQMRLVAALRGDHYQVPNTPDQQAVGIRDTEDEHDALVNFSWLHAASRGLLLTVSPFYHLNGAHYLGSAADTHVSPEDERTSSYAGGVVSLGFSRGPHNGHAGVQLFAQRDRQLFGIVTTGDNPVSIRQQEVLWGNNEAFFLEDQYKLTRWITLNAGVRLTHFGGVLSETAVDPRLGAAWQIPRLRWALRAFWGRYYQPPPLLTVSGPLLDLAGEQGFGFLPLPGERDEQREFGLAIPLAGWSIDISNFRTSARNYFDHDALGNSNIFFPLTIERARIRGWEVTASSPRIASRVQAHLAYSHQFAEGFGGVTGGLTDFEPPEGGYFFLDHDQRDTLSAGANLDLSRSTWASFNFNYGSGFLDGDGPDHLPAHSTYDVSLGHSLGEAWEVRLTVLNLSENHYMLDNSNTFGGTHYATPREIAVQLKYRFRY